MDLKNKKHGQPQEHKQSLAHKALSVLALVVVCGAPLPSAAETVRAALEAPQTEGVIVVDSAIDQVEVYLSDWYCFGSSLPTELAFEHIRRYRDLGRRVVDGGEGDGKVLVLDREGLEVAGRVRGTAGRVLDAAQGGLYGFGRALWDEAFPRDESELRLRDGPDFTLDVVPGTPKAAARSGCYTRSDLEKLFRLEVSEARAAQAMLDLERVTP